MYWVRKEGFHSHIRKVNVKGNLLCIFPVTELRLFLSPTTTDLTDLCSGKRNLSYVTSHESQSKYLTEECVTAGTKHVKPRNNDSFAVMKDSVTLTLPPPPTPSVPTIIITYCV